MAKRRRNSSKKANTIQQKTVDAVKPAEVEAVPEPEPVTEAEPEPAAEPEPVRKPEVVEEPEPATVPETEPEPEAAPEPETVTAPETVPEPEAVQEPESVPVPETVPELEPVPVPVLRAEPVRNTIKETTTLMKDKNIDKEPANDGMPEFLRSANSTIRRDGPYKEYTGNAEVLRHAERKGDDGKYRTRNKRRKSRKRESFIASETISLIALAAIILVIFICALKHIEFSTLSVPALIVTSVITVAMGIFLGEAPSYVTLILVALIIIAGAVTGMFSEVITGVVIFLGTVTAIKGKFD